jgi:WD40 repeat protein
MVTTRGESSVDLETAKTIKRIFLSYGRADAEELALRLQQDLEQQGHHVWLDKQQIRSGRSWEHQIEEAILGHDVFIALLSPHAVRRPDGVCLDEISMARYNNRLIIPAMVFECRPPLGIYRLDWIDFQHWQNPARYNSALERLTRTLQADKCAVEGTFSKIFGTLEPLDFRIEVGRLTRDFTGREWLLEEIDKWLEQDDSRVFFITGDPGTGKSAVMAHLQDKHPDVAACHFCVATRDDSTSPERFIRSLAAQLATQLPNFRESLDTAMDKVSEIDPGSLLRGLVAGPLGAEAHDKPVLVLVDGLDEAMKRGDQNIATVLARGLNDLPSWVRLVISSRKEPDIIDLFSRFRPHEIDAGREENLQDVQQYLRRKLTEKKLAERLACAGVTADQVSGIIAEKGAGVFLYAVMAVEGLQSGDIVPEEPDSFPDGLVEFFVRNFERCFPDREDFTRFRPLLDVICAAREPLTAAQLGSFLGRDSFDVEQDMERVAAFFPEHEGRYRAFHKSVVDWLVGEAGMSKRFRVNVLAGHQSIANRLWGDYRGGSRERFLLRHLPTHLVGAERWEDAVSVVCDLEYVEAKVRAGLVVELQDDYRDVLAALPEGQEARQEEERRRIRLNKFGKELAAFGKGERKQYPTIEPIRLKSNEEIAALAKRIAENPTPLDRVRVFAQFARGQAHHLQAHGHRPRFVMQEAYNYADSGPVAEAAERILARESLSPIVLNRPLSRPVFDPLIACLRTLEGHTEAVICIALGSDSRTAVSGSYDKTLRIWDVESGQCLRTLEGHTNLVSCIALGPDGRTAVSGSWDKTLRVWDVKSGQCLRTLNGHTSSIECVALGPDGRTAVSGSQDNTVRIWDVESGQCLRTFGGHTDLVNCIALGRDGRTAVSGSSDKTLLVWDVESGQCLRTLEGHTSSVSCVALSPDGRTAVSGSYDKTLRVWDMESGQSLRTFKGHTSLVSCVTFGPDGKTAESGSWDKTLLVWDVESGQCLRTLKGHTDMVSCIALGRDGRIAVSGSSDKTLLVWDVESGQCFRAVEGQASLVSCVALSPDGMTAVFGSHDKALRVWDVASGKCVRTLEGHTGWIDCVVLGPDGRTALSGSRDNMLRVWNVESGQCLRTLEGHAAWISCIALGPGGKTAVSGSRDNMLRVWNVESGQCLGTFKGHSDMVSCIALAPGGKTAVSGSRDNTLRVWDMESGQCLRTLEGHAAWISCITLSPDGKTVVSGSYDKTLRVWDVESGQCLRTLEGHMARISCAALGPDGKIAVSGSRDKTLRVWDVESGQIIAVLAIDGSISTLAITPDFKHLCYAGAWARPQFARLVNFPLDRSVMGR